MAADKDSQAVLTGNALSAWVNERLLSAAALASLRADFEAHPSRLLIVRDFLRPEIAARLGSFLSDEAEFDRIFALDVDRATHVSEDEWKAAGDGERFFRLGTLRGHGSASALSPNILTFLRFRVAFNGEPFVEFFRQATGLELTSSRINNSYCFQVGDFLGKHTDDAGTRRLAVVLNLSQDWDPDFGGELHMIDSDERVNRVPAEFNTLVMFDVSAGTEHYVSEVKPEAGDRRRVTMSGWLHEPEA